MAKQLWTDRTLSGLLGVKRRLDLTAADHAGEARDADADPLNPDAKSRAEALCINCGYDQQGVHLTRCPECGLPLAAFYRDPTRWGTSGASLSAWWATAVEVWTCQRRLRVRSSMMPATRHARRFSRWSTLVTAVMLSLTMAIAESLVPTPGGLAPVTFALRFLWGTIAIGLLLFGTLYGLAHSLGGTWRHRYPFVPGSVHYATAWWPPVAGLLLAFTALYAQLRSPEIIVLDILFSSVGVFAWALWLWASLVEAERASLPSVRIGAAVLTVSILGSFVAALVPGAAQWTLGQFVATQGGLTKLQILNSLGTGTPSAAPQTYAVIIDMFTDHNSSHASQVAYRLGAGRSQQICMYGDQANIENIRKSMSALLSDLRPVDRLVLYIAGHGAQEGSGAIRVNGGYVTSQMVADFVRDSKTPNNLVIINSCFGGKFIKALRQQHASAVILTSTDQENVGFSTVLRPLWDAWGNSKTDVNGDGRITVAEAYEAAFPEMLKVGERAREANARVEDRTAMMEESGYCTPQYEVLGQASGGTFFVPVADVSDHD